MSVPFSKIGDNEPKEICSIKFFESDELVGDLLLLDKIVDGV